MADVLKIIDNNKDYANALCDSKIPAAIYINAQLVDDKADSPMKFRGLDYALDERAKDPNAAIVLYAIDGLDWLEADRRFMEFMSAKDSHYLRCPFKIKDLQKVIGTKTFYNAALAHAATAESRLTLTQQLAHDYWTNPAQTLERARKELNLEGADETIVAYLRCPSKEDILTDKRFTGTFCDIEGTLITDGKLDENVAHILVDSAQHGPVTLWTGGNIRNFSYALHSQLEEYCQNHNAKDTFSTLHLRTPIVSKHMFRGATVERVIDDIMPDEFTAEYGIKPEEFTQINRNPC